MRPQKWSWTTTSQPTSLIDTIVIYLKYESCLHEVVLLSLEGFLPRVDLDLLHLFPPEVPDLGLLALALLELLGNSSLHEVVHVIGRPVPPGFQRFPRLGRVLLLQVGDHAQLLADAQEILPHPLQALVPDALHQSFPVYAKVALRLALGRAVLPAVLGDARP